MSNFCGECGTRTQKRQRFCHECGTVNNWGNSPTSTLASAENNEALSVSRTQPKQGKPAQRKQKKVSTPIKDGVKKAKLKQRQLIETYNPFDSATGKPQSRRKQSVQSKQEQPLKVSSAADSRVKKHQPEPKQPVHRELQVVRKDWWKAATTSTILGIDLGTTNSAMALLKDGKPKIIANAEGYRTTPSIVALGKEGNLLVGKPAENQAAINPVNTVGLIKRFMGRKHSEVNDEIKAVSCKVVSGKGGRAEVKIGGKSYVPEEISAVILQKLKADAERYIGEEISEAVITVPAYFNDLQRQATKDAAKIAGLNIKRIVNEPTAAALAYGLGKSLDEHKVLVIDFGGGTFDVTVIQLGDNVVEVFATNGDNCLGGDDWNQRIIDWLVDRFKTDQGIDLNNDKIALQRIRDAAEHAKIELSSTQSTHINLPYIVTDTSASKHLDYTLSRSDFEEMTNDLLERTKRPIRQALKDAGIKIDKVILTGGSSRMPAVQELIKSLTGKDFLMSVNPDEIVAMGAAVQGGVLGGNYGKGDILLLDVTSMTLGFETDGGIMKKMIKRNTTIPTRKTETFTTTTDGQTSVSVHILQGEREMAAANKTLGRFTLANIPPAPRGVPQIEVTFDIDANGIVNVSAKDQGTGRKQRITAASSAGLSDKEVDLMAANLREQLKLRQVNLCSNCKTATIGGQLYCYKCGEKTS